RRHTRSKRDWSSDVCSSDLKRGGASSLADALSDAADYGFCASHSRFFYGFRLHTLCAIDGTPRAMALTSPKVYAFRGLAGESPRSEERRVGNGGRARAWRMH